ncbi:MAG: hypothetical protein ABW133_18670 [Polyangiaceae bacterium]
MNHRMLGWVLGLSLLGSATACKHNDGDSVVVTGEGARLPSEVIDRDPLALLPSKPVVLGVIDVPAFLASPLGGEINRLAAKYVPLGQETGFVLSRDLKKMVGGAYSLAGVDVVAVAQGDFNPDLIRAAAERHATTPGGMQLVHSKYAGNDVFTAGNIGFTVVTRHTMLIGNETGMRRALDRIRDNRLARDVPEWMTKLIETPQAATVLAGDVATEPRIAAMARMAPFLGGLSTFRLVGNFQPPGVNVAGTLTYVDAPSAAAGANALRGLAQTTAITAVLSIFGLGAPLQNLQIENKDRDTNFVTASDAESLARLLAQVM